MKRSRETTEGEERGEMSVGSQVCCAYRYVNIGFLAGNRGRFPSQNSISTRAGFVGFVPRSPIQPHSFIIAECCARQTTMRVTLLAPCLSRVQFNGGASKFGAYAPRLQTRALSVVNTFIGPLHKMNVKDFQDQAFRTDLPLLITRSIENFIDTAADSQIPAAKQWFMPTRDGIQTLNYQYLQKFEYVLLPYELVSYSVKDSTILNGDNCSSTIITGDNASKFVESVSFRRFTAPLQLLLAVSQSDNPPQLYIAQAQLEELPKALRNDIPIPHLVLEAGKGDVYDANLWMGIPPTYTPLHKDPNPNLFVQLSGSKVVRLFAPNDGLAIFRDAQIKIGGQASAAFRGDEMMHGPERRELEDAVWDHSSSTTGYEVVVRPGDALFIPMGWWHSIKSIGRDITASVSYVLDIVDMHY
jgi:hypothetical protein